MERHTYYVQLDPTMMGISDIKTSENTIQYQIHATPNEKLELEKIINAAQDENTSDAGILERVHDEKKEEEAKNDWKGDMQELYKKIYELGSPETRDFIKQQHLDE